MHLLRLEMSSQSHLWLRLGALALIAIAVLWPRASRGGPGADGVTAAEVMRGASDSAMNPPAGPARAETRTSTAAARFVSSPRMTKLVVADADDSRLNN